MNASLKIVTGHVYVVAWFLAMHDHINKHDWSHVILLWQAALTVTLHCRVGLNSKQLAVLSIQMSETQKERALDRGQLHGFLVQGADRCSGWRHHRAEAESAE